MDDDVYVDHVEAVAKPAEPANDNGYTIRKKFLKCSELEKNRQVVFNIESDILGRKEPTYGNVVYVLPERKSVRVARKYIQYIQNTRTTKNIK